MAPPSKNRHIKAQKERFKTPAIYSYRVLTDNWRNKLFEITPVETKHYQTTTTYEEKFAPKYAPRDYTVLWDQKMSNEESNFIPQVGRNDFPNYFENFSSTYDLSFNHFPKCFKNFKGRTLRFRTQTYEPTYDYTPSFGNLTKYGLLDHMREEWANAVQDPRREVSTHYKDTFTAPEADYKPKKFGTPSSNSSILSEINRVGLALNLRGKPVCHVPAYYDLVTVPRPSRYNPITWELVPEMPQTKL